ncbi:MAG TPA: hypothetical protein VFY90_12750, partial [Tepidiformaceae bacterium]|nr:hypothetical protein [Tepidiformaceae bacterium]
MRHSVEAAEVCHGSPSSSGCSYQLDSLLDFQQQKNKRVTIRKLYTGSRLAILATALLLCIGAAWLKFSGDGGSGADNAEAAVPGAATPGWAPSFPAYRIPEDQRSSWMQAATDAERAVIA